jgi:hypothetical protein
MSMKNSKDTIGNRSHDLLVCGTVPQPLHHRVPLYLGGQVEIQETTVHIMKVIFIIVSFEDSLLMVKQAFWTSALCDYT